jgi:50S ribosomal protein L16 3-hydroxylase
VFLVQGSGRRKWQIDSSGRTGPEDFEPDQEWVLEPGDSLYLPPRIPHNGVALEPCMTFSIGCRAPTHVELVAGFLGHVVETMNADERYRDADLTASDDPGRIAPGALQRVGDVIERLFSEPRAVGRWFGRSVTEPRRRFEPFEPERRYSADELRAALRSGGRLSRSAVSHYAYILWEDETASLFVGGEEYPLKPELAPIAPLLAGATALDASALNDNLDEPAIVSLLVALIERGFLLVDSTAGSAAAADSEER